MTKFYKEGEIMIGKSVPRVDAYEKVTGRAKFTDDLVPPRCLVAKVLQPSRTVGKDALF